MGFCHRVPPASICFQGAPALRNLRKQLMMRTFDRCVKYGYYACERRIFRQETGGERWRYPVAASRFLRLDAHKHARFS